jgi:ATP/maltotriose-dependent transcriptional regulator MalT
MVERGWSSYATVDIQHDVGYVGFVSAGIDGGGAMARIPLVTDGVLQGTAAGESAHVPVGSTGWFAWLADDEARSFSFRSPEGTYTARKERRQRGGAYWVAYRTVGGRQHKMYLGTVADLTPERLAEAAAALTERIADAAATASDSPTGSSASPGRIAQNAPGLLLATKLFVPRPRPDLIMRPRLLGRLNEGLDRGRCSLLSAPAGTGKTSLLATWAAQLDRPVAWLSLDERDQDVNQVLRYLVASVQTISPGCGRTASALLDAPPPPSPEIVLTSLLNDVAALPAPAVLVLDDYHVVRAPAVHAAIKFLLDHLPPSLHLVIATREDPPLPLPRLRASRQMIEMRAADLSFNVEEAGAFLDAGMGVHLTEQQVMALVERTEGWAAGLLLAGLALRDRSDVAAFVDAFTGGHRLVADYLIAEVLEREPVPVRRFLLVTSVLDRLCAPLCDVLRAGDPDSAGASPPATSSQEILEGLEAANLFLVPLDDERMWYRYHHLFADALRGRLVREAGPEALALLHRQASVWFGQQGLLPEAIGHALASGAVEDAAAWLEGLMPTVFANVSIHQTLEGWLRALPDRVVRARPMLCLMEAWLLIHGLKYAEAADWLDTAARSLPAVGENHARGAIAATRAFIATLGPAAVPEDVRMWAEQALTDLAPDDMAFRGVAALSHAQAELALGHSKLAEQAFAEIAAAAQAAGLFHGALVATTHQVNVARLRGTRRYALATARTALARAHEHIGPLSVGLLQAVVADLLLDENDLVAAPPLATDALEAQRQYGNQPPLVLITSLTVAQVRLARGEVAEAAAVLDEVSPLIQHEPFGYLAPLLDAAEAQVNVALGETAAAAAWAATVEPMALPNLLRFHPHFLVAAVKASAVTPAQTLLTHGRATRDAALLGQAERQLETAWSLVEQGFDWLRLRVLILRALISDAFGDRNAALGSLATAVALAEPEGVIRPFLDEGSPMSALLNALRATTPGKGRASIPYLDKLLGAFTGQKPTHDTPGPAPTVVPSTPSEVVVEPLSARELDVLRLLDAGRSNTEIASDLFVEQSTVKTHLIHLYRKLGVSSRTQAITRARALRLLD